ncbi:hypothetical protein VTK56DRAFT_3360 [Thermocarpiscus australiensis]
MGWFDGWFGSSSSSESDPLRRLDPKLREFLERESPVKYTTSDKQTTQPQSPVQAQSPPRSQQSSHSQPSQPTAAAAATEATAQQQQQQQTPPVPPESLFPDGRYAHLWKTYRPLAHVEAETKSDHEKLSDVLEAYKERRAQIGRAALENCADEQVAWHACMRSGTWEARLRMCRDEVQRFERCYTAQSRLLRALGYLSVAGRGPEVDEAIQMRADELFHRMLAQEREIERAKAEGREPPAFKPLFDKGTITTTTTTTTATTTGGEQPPAAAAAAAAAAGGSVAGAGTAMGAELPGPSPATLNAWKEKLEKLPPEEREAEEQALRAEHRAKAEVAARIQGIWEEQAREREARKLEGKETLFDRFKSLVWSGPSSGPKST